MSLENDLGRIATSLEIIAKHLTQDRGNPLPSVPADKVTKVTKIAKKEPEVAAEPEVDPFAQPEAEEEITLAKLTEVLREHSVKLGVKVTTALMIKHGANAVATKLASIPTANYKACFDDAKADLAKLVLRKS